MATPSDVGADPAFGPSDPSRVSPSRPVGFNPGEFTPGPWTVYHDGFSVAAADGHIIGTWAEGYTDDEAAANARLIAAAPQLYEELCAAVELIDDQLGGDFPETLREMRAVLAKAKVQA